ncbi:MAG: hypothetical protein HYZ75_02650 [Elusimicrobia bacterium]|nr:hypothetical protein [Elusimicrobiota bacterium]
MLQTEYARATKDADVLETLAITAEVKDQLLGMAGKGKALHERFGLYLDVVPGGLPFLPQKALFHPVAGLGRLKNFTAEALDVTDVIVSKLRRFNSSDDADARSIAELGLLEHKRLVARFEKALDSFLLDARAADLPKIIRNLNKVERDYLGAPPSAFDLPDWV